MEVIRKADDTLEKMLGRQDAPDEHDLQLAARATESGVVRSIDALGMRYRLSNFVITDGDLMHSTLTGELLRASNADLPELIARHYYVPEGTDEVKLCGQMRTVMALIGNSGRSASYTIMPTTCCNARCFYCYENGIEQASMTDGVADDVVAFIRRTAKGKAKLAWFGGEPLLGVRYIDRICAGLSGTEGSESSKGEPGIEFSSKMTTNGFLLDSALVAHAKQAWHLKRVQITLDGTERVYNSAKRYKPDAVESLGAEHCGSPFQRVLDNIQYLLDAEIRVDLRMNVGSYNVADIATLIDELQRFKGDCFRPYVHALFGEEDGDQLDVACAQLHDMLVARGLVKPGRALDKLRANWCMADADSAYTINPRGGITKCEHFAFEQLVGTVTEGVDASKAAEWKRYSVPAICSDCPLLPSCILLDRCPNAKPCSAFERARRIEQTKITMRAKAEEFAREQTVPQP